MILTPGAASGSWSFQLYGCVTGGCSDVTRDSITINATLGAAAPTVTSLSPSNGPAGGGSSVTITGTNFTGAAGVKFGGSSAVSFAVINATQISATAPAGAGTVDVTVTTAGGTSVTSAADRFTYVAAPVAGAASATVAHGSSGNPVTLNISGGTPTSVAVAGAAAHGVAMASGTSISYTPSASYSGADSFTYTATNAGGTSASATVSITVSAPTLSYTPASPPAGAVGAAYSQSLAGASGGTAPYTYALASGSLPAGVALGGNGMLSGTPTAAGTFNFAVAATDNSTGTGPFSVTSGTLSLSVAAPNITLSPAALAAATVGAATNQTLAASGGIGAYSYAVTMGALPAGLSLSSGGVLSGTPTAGGLFNFTVTATDGSGAPGPYTGSRAYALTVNTPTIAVVPASLSAVAAGASVSGAISASGGTSGYTYSVTAGALPPGISLSGLGVFSGAATATGSYSFTVSATDSSSGAGPYTGSRGYTWTVNPPALAISPASGSTLSGSALSAYSQAFTPSGGNAPYTYGIVINSGAMPAGLGFNTGTGVLWGTPTAAGTVNFTVTATDATTGAGSPFQVAATYNLTIGAPTIVVTPAGSIPNPVAGAAYSQTFNTSGGSAPYGYVITAGALPAGLTLSAAGVLSGTPTAAGAFNFTVRATDNNSFAGTRAYSVTVAAPLLAVAPASLPGGMASVPYSQTVSGSGGTGPYSYAVTAGALPAGLGLNAVTGVLGGTPSTANTYNFTVTVTDSTTGAGAPFTASRAYTVIVAPAPVQTVSGSGVTLAIANTGAACAIDSHAFTAQAQLAVPPPAGYGYPYAAVDFSAKQCDTNSDLTVTLTFSSPVPANAVLMKYDATATPRWQPFTPASISGNQVTYTIHDGGALDGDKAANGEFVDPVVLGVPLAAGVQSVPALERWALLLLTLILGAAMYRLKNRAGR